MECPLCAIWARMPYQKRWSTPTTAHDTEGALIIGFWLGIKHFQPSTPPQALCGKHASLIEHLNRNPSQLASPHLATVVPTQAQPRRISNHTFQALSDPPPPNAICSYVEGSNVCGKTARYEASANFDTNGHIGVIKQHLCSEHAIALAERESKPEPEAFKLGLVPLANENTNTEPPPLPVVTPLIPLLPNTQPNVSNGPQIQAAIESALRIPITPRSTLPQNPPIDPMELARQAALMPAEMGRKIESFTPEEPDEELTKP